MGEFLSPLVIAAVVGNVGFCEGLKRKFPKLSTFITSILGGLVGAFGVANLSMNNVFSSIQSFILNWFIVTCVAWLSYELVVSRFTIKKDNDTTVVAQESIK